ncbi:hypothetical protein LB543_17570 [Mesorhizobium sp. ESP7-2]|uniref:hypothetical protein n=1 Tax=Mesorhizobium sp. ESP7-2 TaxID=2876622 RepID=UPI001CCCDAF2|nr:hypothetical protein [Mesorhizobium sp. ESP7-2]MBZ9708532.1 hypothetical protein [Mesorhizobium sp. ESP7-2]
MTNAATPELLASFSRVHSTSARAARHWAPVIILDPPDRFQSEITASRCGGFIGQKCISNPKRKGPCFSAIKKTLVQNYCSQPAINFVCFASMGKPDYGKTVLRGSVATGTPSAKIWSLGDIG